MKKNSLHLFITFCCAILVSSGTWVFAASTRTKIAKQSAIQSGTSVRTKTEATGLYDQKCYDLYYGCMDQFCIMDNADGGSCACSDEKARQEQVEKEDAEHTGEDMNRQEKIKQIEANIKEKQDQISQAEKDKKQIKNNIDRKLETKYENRGCFIRVC